MKRLVLLGGGHAHAHVLSQWAGARKSAAELTLVSPAARQLYSGMIPGWLAGHYDIEQCAIPLPSLAQAAGAKFIEASATAIDPRTRQVQLSNGQVLNYELLSIDTGAVMDRDAIPGARENALFVRPIAHFVRLSEGLLGLAQTRQIGVAVIGGGAAGVELVLALQHRLGDQARLSLVTGGTPPLPGFTAAMQARATAALRRARITVLQERCIEITATHLMLANGAKLACDAPIAAWGTGPTPWLQSSGLALDEQGFLQTGPTLQSTSHADVFAVGDVASRVDEPHPKSGVYAVRSGPPLLNNLLRSLGGQALLPYTPPKRSLALLACGPRYAIGAWGSWSFEGAWVWRLKDGIDQRFVRRYRPHSASSDNRL